MTAGKQTSRENDCKYCFGLVNVRSIKLKEQALVNYITEKDFDVVLITETSINPIISSLDMVLQRMTHGCHFLVHFYIYSCTGLFSYCVIPLSWGGATPSQINSLGRIQAHHLIWGSASFYPLAFQCSIHSCTDSLQIEVWWLGMLWWTTFVPLCAPVT